MNTFYVQYFSRTGISEWKIDNWMDKMRMRENNNKNENENVCERKTEFISRRKIW